MLTTYKKKIKLISLLLSSLIIMNYIIMFIHYNKFLSTIIAASYLLLIMLFFFLKINESAIFKLTLLMLGIIAAGSPPVDWDTWAIWLFHAKRIFIEENFFVTLNNYTNLHNSYPLIAPSFMASFGNLIQGWNLLLPKFSIYLLYIPPLIYANSIFNNKFNLILLLITNLIINKFLFNGYIDGLIAIYFSFCVYLIYELIFEEKKDIVDFLILYFFLTILSLLKNEGFVLVLIILSLLFIKNFIDKKKVGKIDKNFFLYLSIFPYLLWKLVSIINGIGTDVVSDAKFERIINYDILMDSILMIFESLFLNFQSLMSFLVLVISFYFCKDKKLLYVTLYCIVIYMLILISIYFITPHDLSWHLNTSGARVMMAIHYVVFLSSLISFNKNYRFI